MTTIKIKGMSCNHCVMAVTKALEGIGSIKNIKVGDLCKTPPFAQFLRQAQILSLEILNVFLRLKFLPSLNLNKIEHFSKLSVDLKKGEAMFDEIGTVDMDTIRKK